MPKILLAALTASVLACTVAACARGPKKSSAHVYSGNSPTIHFSDKPETAGGRLQTY